MTVALFRTGFWVPLAVCTYLALVPQPPPLAIFRLGDVLLHAGAFAYLAFALALMLESGGRREAIPIRTFCWLIGYGAGLEIVQALIPERSAELKDLLVDAVGIALGLLVAHFAAPAVRRFAERILG